MNFISLNIGFHHLCSGVYTYLEQNIVAGHPAPPPVNLKTKIIVTWAGILS